MTNTDIQLAMRLFENKSFSFESVLFERVL